MQSLIVYSNGSLPFVGSAVATPTCVAAIARTHANGTADRRSRMTPPSCGVWTARTLADSDAPVKTRGALAAVQQTQRPIPWTRARDFAADGWSRPCVLHGGLPIIRNPASPVAGGCRRAEPGSAARSAALSPLQSGPRAQDCDPSLGGLRATPGSPRGWQFGSDVACEIVATGDRLVWIPRSRDGR